MILPIFIILPRGVEVFAVSVSVFTRLAIFYVRLNRLADGVYMFAVTM